jgi:hypothetical protein
MRRSIMIKRIVEILEDWEGSKLDEQLAEEILKTVEKSGMLPPTVNIWEEEDE